MTPTYENKYKLLNIIPMCFQKTSPNVAFMWKATVFFCVMDETFIMSNIVRAKQK